VVGILAVFMKCLGGITMQDLKIFSTSDGSEIEVTEEILEDLYIVSKLYNVSVKDLVKDVFSAELEGNL
jgi:hypothetical protein